MKKNEKENKDGKSRGTEQRENVLRRENENKQ